MDIRHYVRFLRRNWMILIACVLLGGIAGVLYSTVQPVKYSSSAALYVSSASASSLTDANQGSTYTQQLVKGFADVATKPYVLDGVITQLHLDVSAEQLAAQISATAPSDTAVLTITATDRSSIQAAKIANTVATELSKRVTTLSPDSSDGTATVKVTLIQSATPSTSPDQPRPILNTGFAAIFGLLFGLVLAYARSRVDTRFHTLREVSALSGLPTIGTIPYDSSARTRPLVASDLSTGLRGESYKTLRTNLQFLQLDGGPVSIVITSSIPGEGKSTVASNLAIAIADAGRRVLLIDADLRRPRIQTNFGLDGDIGLTDVLVGNTKFTDAVQEWGGRSLSILPAGQIPPNPTELLQSPQMRDLLRAAEADYDMVIIDSPPLLPVSDAAILAEETAGALVICALGKAKHPQLAAALESLTRTNSRALGIVATMVPSAASYGGAYGAYEYEAPGRLVATDAPATA